MHYKESVFNDSPSMSDCSETLSNFKIFPKLICQAGEDWFHTFNHLMLQLQNGNREDGSQECSKRNFGDVSGM